MKQFIQILSLIVFFSCNSSTLDLPDFDEIGWRKDSDGCLNIRSKMRGQLIKTKNLLKGHNGDDIVALLGKPNSTNLADRNQKHFLYAVTCASDSLTSSTLSIRFNAVGLAYEVVVY